MKKSLAGGVGVAAAFVVVFGSGVASADIQDYVGQTYEKAARSINTWAEPVITSREGSYLPTEQCIVTRVRKGNSLDSRGRSSGNTVLLDLNCSDSYAGKSGHPGNSATTDVGKQVKRFRASGVKISDQYAKAVAEGKESEFFCGLAEYLTWCRKVCDQGGTCSDELVKYLS